MEDPLSLLTVYEWSKENKKRYGANADGGYVVAVLPGNYDCYLSCGVCEEESFTRDFLNDHTYLPKTCCHAFDGTIEDYPWSYTNNIIFHKKNISGNETSTETNLHYFLQIFKDVIIKMDIEVWEVPWILSLSRGHLQNIKQIVFELHGVFDNSLGVQFQHKLKCLEIMNQTHYLVHVHGNSACPKYVNNVPSVIELTYVRKSEFPYPLPLNKDPLPIEGLDFGNNSNNNYDLNFPPFVNK